MGGKAVGVAERLGPFRTETEWGGEAEGYMWLGSEVEQRLLEVLRGVLKTGYKFIYFNGQFNPN